MHVDNSNFNYDMLKYGTVKRNKNNKKLNDDDDYDDDDYGGDKNNGIIQQQQSNIQCCQSDLLCIGWSQTTWSDFLRTCQLGFLKPIICLLWNSQREIKCFQ